MRVRSTDSCQYRLTAPNSIELRPATRALETAYRFARPVLMAAGGVGFRSAAVAATENAPPVVATLSLMNMGPGMAVDVMTTLEVPGAEAVKAVIELQEVEEGMAETLRELLGGVAGGH